MKSGDYSQDGSNEAGDGQGRGEKWTKDEHEIFLQALHLFGRDWKRISDYIGTKTLAQVRAHAYSHFSKIQNGKSKGFVPPKHGVRPTMYPEMGRPFPLMAPGEMMMRNYMDRPPMHTPIGQAQGPPRIPMPVPGMMPGMMAQNAMLEQERLKFFQNQMMLQNLVYHQQHPSPFPAHAPTPPHKRRESSEDHGARSDKRRREKTDAYDDSQEEEDEEYDPDEEYEDDSDVPRRRSKSRQRDSLKHKRKKRQGDSDDAEPRRERAEPPHRLSEVRPRPSREAEDSQSDGESKARSRSESKEKTKKDKRERRNRYEDENESSSPVGGNATNAAESARGEPAPHGSLAQRVNAMQNVIENLSGNAGDAISPDLQRLLQLQGHHPAAPSGPGSFPGAESAAGLNAEFYAHMSRNFHPGMVPLPPSGSQQFNELLRAHHSSAAAFGAAHYGIGHPSPYGGGMPPHASEPLHPLHAHGRYPSASDYLRRPPGLPTPPPGVPMPMHQPPEFYRMLSGANPLAKGHGHPEGLWNIPHVGEEGPPAGMYGVPGMGMSDPLMSHARAQLSRQQEEAFAHLKIPRPQLPQATAAPLVESVVGGLAARPSPPIISAAPSRSSSIAKDEDVGSSGDQSNDDRDDGLSKKKRERWTQEEHELFLKGLEMYGRKWTKIQALIPNKTVTQVRTHAYGYFAKLLRRVPNERDLLEVAHIMSAMRNREGGEEDDGDEEGDAIRGDSPTDTKAKDATVANPKQPSAKPKRKPDENADAEHVVVDAEDKDAADDSSSKRRKHASLKNPLHLLAKFAEGERARTNERDEDDDDDDDDDDEIPEEGEDDENDDLDEDDDAEDVESDEERRALEAIRNIARRGGEQRPVENGMSAQQETH